MVLTGKPWAVPVTVIVELPVGVAADVVRVRTVEHVGKQVPGANVAVTPGAAFGPNAEGYLRFSYASSIERIEEGLRRIERFLSARR